MCNPSSTESDHTEDPDDNCMTEDEEIRFRLQQINWPNAQQENPRSVDTIAYVTLGKATKMKAGITFRSTHKNFNSSKTHT